MDAVQFVDHGDRGVIECGSYPDPAVGPETVLVDVKAGALNHLDLWSRRCLPGIELGDGFGKVVVVPDSEYEEGVYE